MTQDKVVVGVNQISTTLHRGTDRFELTALVDGHKPVVIHCGEVTLRTLLPLWKLSEDYCLVECKDLQTGGRVISIAHDEIVEEIGIDLAETRQ